MAYNTQSLVQDRIGRPTPQYYNPATDSYEVLQGVNGANRVVLYGPDGNPLSTTGGRLDAHVSELDITLSALRDALRGVDSKTISDLVTLLTAIRDSAGIKKVVDPVDIADRATRALGKVTADDNAIAGLGALAAAAVTDPAASASLIALLKGLLKQLQGTGSGAAPVQLTGSLVPRQTNSGIIFSALAITDTSPHTGSTVSVEGCGKKILSITNTLNQPVNVTCWGTTEDGTSKTISSSFTIPGSTGGFLGGYLSGIGGVSPIPGLLEPMAAIYCVASCGTAPTSGSLTIKISMEV